MSGRTGSFTYRQSRGQTIVSQYQPIVKNPNTGGQQTQRAKFKLMSQLAAVMSSGFGTMGVTKRPAKQTPTQRNAFMQLNMPLVQVDNSANGVSAKIPMERVKLTSSLSPLGQITAQGSVEQPQVAITEIPSGVSAVRFVEVGYREYQEVDPSTGSFITKTRAEVLRVTDIPVDTTSNTAVLSAEYNTTVLAYGLIPSQSLTGVDLNNIHTPQDEGFISAVNLDMMVSSGLMAETMTLGINID